MDNRYYSYSCPPLMNDGRFISNYVRSSLFDQYIKSSNNLDSSYDFKNFLQKNGSTILNNIKSYYRKENSCSIGGKCLPISHMEDNFAGFDDHNDVGKWFDALLDENHSDEMNFMMSSPPSLNDYHSVNNNIMHVNNPDMSQMHPDIPQMPTMHANPESQCTSCHV